MAKEKEEAEVVVHQTGTRPPNAQPDAKQPQPKPLKKRTTFLDKKIVAQRPSRAGDDGYQLSTIDDQVTIIFEDGGEKVIKSSDLYEPA